MPTAFEMPRTFEVKARNALRKIGVEIVPTRRRSEVSLLGLHLSRIFALYHIDVVIDVGARVGEYGIWLRENGYRGWIVSFEPVAESFQVLSERAGRDEKWKTMHCALGDRDGEAQISVTQMTQFSSLLPMTEYARRFPTRTEAIETVTVRRLDTIWAELPQGQSTYLKLDTQGYDLRVLDGMGDRLSSIVALQTEAAVQRIYKGAPSHLESMAYLERLGFTPSGMFPVTLDTAMRLVEYDCVAVRSTGFESA